MIVYTATNTVNGMQYVVICPRKDGHFRQARKGQGFASICASEILAERLFASIDPKA